MEKMIGVFGSSGKMGSGIAELLMHYPFHQLVCIDIHKKNTDFRKSLRTFAEKNINSLREKYKDNPSLISNEEMIDHFLEEQLDRVIFTDVIEEAKHAEWIFEAIVEDVEQKVQLFKALKKIVSKYTLFFSNTSAIPIQTLSQKADLDRIIGFHFYNPPTHNKMMEIVVTDSMKPTAESLAKELKRTYVFAGDVPGFIGNGHFIRELKFALDLNLPPEKIDQICEEKLLRPFGPFKLAQFIGIPTVLAISKIMGIDCSKLTHMSLPKITKPHKAVTTVPDLKDETARKILTHSKEIGELLVQTGAAPDLKSVETVLKVGFQHPYGFEYV